MADALVSSENVLPGEESDEEDTDEEATEPFTEAGRCDDEVILKFDNKKRLFVSRNFLRLSSPVFDAMFNGEFKEKQENCVRLPGKNYDHFLTFLMCIHPAVFNPVDESNVLCIAPIAEEYQVTSIQNACYQFMKSWLNDSVEKASKKTEYHPSHAQPLRCCLNILTTANMLNCEDVITLAVINIAKFGHVLYNNNQNKPSTVSSPGFMQRRPQRVADLDIKECTTLFGNLPVGLQCRILSDRLRLLSDYDLK